MAPEHPELRERVDNAERDLRDHSKTISVLVGDQRELRTLLVSLEQDRAVRSVEDRHLDERLDHIEERIKGVYSLGLWLLAAVGMALIAIIVEFVAKGGLTHVS